MTERPLEAPPSRKEREKDGAPAFVHRAIVGSSVRGVVNGGNPLGRKTRQPAESKDPLSARSKMNVEESFHKAAE
jgi:hypothetical protein